MVNERADSGITGDSLYTHLNITSDEAKAELDLYSSVDFIYSLTDNTSDLLIKFFQDYFSAYSLGKAFQAKLGQVNKEVVVLDQYAPDTMQLPQIVVASQPADNFPTSLGNKVGQEEYNGHTFLRYSGMVNMNTTFELYDSGKPNVHKLADVVFLGLMYYIPTRCFPNHITVDTTKVRFSNAVKTTGPVVGGEVYLIKLVVPVLAEWNQYFEVVAPVITTVRPDVSLEEVHTIPK